MQTEERRIVTVLFADLVDNQTQGWEQEVVFFGVLSAEQTLFSPEEAIRGVLVAPHIQEGRRHQTTLGNEAPGSGDGLVLAGFQMKRGHMGKNPLAGETATADPLALLGHDVEFPEEG